MSAFFFLAILNVLTITLKIKKDLIISKNKQEKNLKAWWREALFLISLYFNYIIQLV